MRELGDSPMPGIETLTEARETSLASARPKQPRGLADRATLATKARDRQASRERSPVSSVMVSKSYQWRRAAGRASVRAGRSTIGSSIRNHFDEGENSRGWWRRGAPLRIVGVMVCEIKTAAGNGVRRFAAAPRNARQTSRFIASRGETPRDFGPPADETGLHAIRPIPDNSTETFCEEGVQSSAEWKRRWEATARRQAREYARNEHFRHVT